MDKYIITIKKDNRAHMFGRYFQNEHDKIVYMDVLEALFHLHLIDEYIIKEAPEHERL